MTSQIKYPLHFRYFTDILFLAVAAPIMVFAFVGLMLVIVTVPFLEIRSALGIIVTCALFICIVWWLGAVFLYPRYQLIKYQEKEASVQKRDRLSEYIKGVPLLNILFAYVFLSIFLFYIIASYEAEGPFFMDAPASIWNAIISGLNILTGDSLNDFVKNTDAHYTFARYDDKKIVHKLIIRATQLAIALGLIKSAIDVVKLNDDAYQIKVEPNKTLGNEGS